MRKADEPEGKTFTYQARVPVDAGAAAALDAYAELFGRVERTLFARSTAQGVKPEKLKNEYLKRFGITGRQFNAIRVSLDGKTDSVKERRTGLIDEAKTRLKKAQATLKKLGTAPKSETPEAEAKRLDKLHQKTRRAVTMAARLESMQADHKAGRVRIAFGSRRLFRAQFDLSANGFADHAAWRDAWHRARSEQFSVLGSKDETGGCQAVSQRWPTMARCRCGCACPIRWSRPASTSNSTASALPTAWTRSAPPLSAAGWSSA